MFEIDSIQDEHYNVRKRVPNHLEVFADWRQRSGVFAETAKATFDVRYGTGEKAVLDLFQPETVTEKTPLHIFIHGGYWQALDKADHSFVAKPFVERGIAVAVVNYDLCPGVSLSHIVDQMREALVWASGNGEKYGYDINQIHISGHSAGGHLVGCLLASNFSVNLIKSSVAISGLYDLAPLVQTSINQVVGLSMNEAKRLSPLKQKCFSQSPVLCIVGGAEGDGFIGQSRNAVDDWTSQGLETDLVIANKANHFDVVNSFVDPASDIFKKVMRFYSVPG